MKPHNAKMFKVTAANYADEVQLFSCFLWIFSSQKTRSKASREKSCQAYSVGRHASQAWPGWVLSRCRLLACDKSDHAKNADRNKRRRPEKCVVSWKRLVYTERVAAWHKWWLTQPAQLHRGNSRYVSLLWWQMGEVKKWYLPWGLFSKFHSICRRSWKTIHVQFRHVR